MGANNAAERTRFLIIYSGRCNIFRKKKKKNNDKRNKMDEKNRLRRVGQKSSR